MIRSNVNLAQNPLTSGILMRRLCLPIALSLLLLPEARAQHVRLASTTDQGLAADSWSSTPVLSGDGSVVLFESGATNLVPGDTNNSMDLFTYDLATGATEAVSVDRFGGLAGGVPNLPLYGRISRSGRFVAFTSESELMVEGGQVGGIVQVYVRDRLTSTTVRISRSLNGEPANANCGQWAVGLSESGRFVVFDSRATAYGIQTNLATAGSLVIHDRDADEDGVFDELEFGAVRWSPAAFTAGGLPFEAVSGTQFLEGVEVTDDGRLVLFSMRLATETYYQMRLTDRDVDGDGQLGEPGDVSTDYLHPEAGHQVVGHATPDMRHIAYGGPLIPGGFYVSKVVDRFLGSTLLVDGVSPCFRPTISDDGRFIAVWSALPLAPDDTNSSPDVYRLDRDADEDGVFDEPGSTKFLRISVARSGGASGASHSDLQWISGDGRRVAFVSSAPLTATDMNSHQDVFVYDILHEGGRARVR